MVQKGTSPPEHLIPELEQSFQGKYETINTDTNNTGLKENLINATQ